MKVTMSPIITIPDYKYTFGDEVYFVENIFSGYTKFGINKGIVKSIFIKKIDDKDVLFYQIESYDEDQEIEFYINRMESECFKTIEELRPYLNELKEKYEKDLTIK